MLANAAPSGLSNTCSPEKAALVSIGQRPMKQLRSKKAARRTLLTEKPPNSYLCRLMEKTNTETWELDFEWLRVRHLVQDTMKRDSLPDLNAILFLVGIQELGRWEKGIHQRR